MTSVVTSFTGRAAASGDEPGRSDPVFVLCMGRSGSTLLRFLLDGHPELACPPETSLPALCGQLAVVWSLIEGAPLSADRGDTPPEVPDSALAGIRHMVDELTGSYLARRGKKRFCDKSLGSAQFASLLMRVYPGARFLCLYRHPMDVIRSGLDACPWGLNGYGFDAYIGGSPGNAVMALARYWLDNATMIAAVESQHPDRCHRIRYEDLVAAPEETAREIFAFLGVRPVPGIAESCFSAEREQFGPADHKIWATSKISADSVGRGESIPVGLIPPPVISGINDLAGQLGYLPVNEDWGTPGMSGDPRVPETIRAAVRPAGQPGDIRGADEAAASISALHDRLRAGLDRIDERFTSQWAPCLGESFVLVSRPVAAGAEGEAGLLVDLAGRTISGCDPAAAGEEWTVIGSPQAWSQVLAGEVNLHVAARRCDLRYCDPGEEGPFDAQVRIGMLADLLSLSSWRQADPVALAPAGHSLVPAAGS
jgi:protein-tyrosine sulfotransferase